jgi:hypothetical protein
MPPWLVFLISAAAVARAAVSDVGPAPGSAEC